MISHVTVREYARLTTSQVERVSLDLAQVPESAFDWLCELSASFHRSGAPLLQMEGRRLLRLDNYVGVIETPCGFRLEILPKHTTRTDCVQESRTLLQRIIQTVMTVSARQVGPADLQLFDAPLSEWVMQQFLLSLDYLIKRGLRFDYRRVEEEQRFLRGQLNVDAQMRQPMSRQHVFQIRHDVFTSDRPENRLLKRAVARICKQTQMPDNWRLAHELHDRLREVPTSRAVIQDFELWRDDRLMAHYQPIKPWCELILGDQSPLTVHGNWRGISLLFPMERLFERYVEIVLREKLHPQAQLHAQPAQHSLCTYREKSMFGLEPDLLLKLKTELKTDSWILDAKWKLLDTSGGTGNYGLDNKDIFQLFAYGQKYLNGAGDMALIYPKTERFKEALQAPFMFSKSLRLWLLPFDLQTDRLLGSELPNLPLLQ